MKRFFILAALCLSTFGMSTSTFAQTAASKKDAKKTNAKKPPAAQPLTIPKDAVQNADGTYSYTDKAGRKWTYAKTPFGISRTEDLSAGAGATPAPTPAAQHVTATDKGETVLFERATPFGTTKWEKNKADLTEEEKQILAAQQQSKPE